MIGRRAFLGAAGALAAAPGAFASASPGRIDVQSHLYPPEILDLLEKREVPPRLVRRGDDRIVIVGPWERRVLPKHTDVRAKLADMDAAGIATAAISINDPGPELFGADGPAVARIQNDYIASVVRAHPDRFIGLMVLPHQDVPAALHELERGAGKLGLKGVLLYSNLGGRFPDEPEFRPFIKRVEEMDLPILLHPCFPTTYEATKGYEMVGGLGLMFDTTIALGRIILSGLLDQHPRIKLVCPHVGGTLPYLIGRLDHQTQVLKRGARNLRKPPSEYLKQVWLDTVTPLPAALRLAIDVVGADRLLFASDHPWVDPQLMVSVVHGLQLPAADEDKIFRDNARRLFRL